MLSVKGAGGGKPEGQYVWEKYNIITYPDLTMTVLSSENSSTVIQVSSDDVDLSAVDSSYFIGYSGNLPSGGSEHIITFTTATDVHILWSGTNNLDTTFTYDSSTARITIANPWNGTPTDTFTKEIKEFIGYIVADDEDKYPNGAFHSDGYWYEKIDGGLTPEVFGCSKVAIDKFTFSTQQDLNTRLSHSLGVVPVYAFLVSTQNVSLSYAVEYGTITEISSADTYYGMARLKTNSGHTYSTYSLSNASLRPTNATVQFLGGSYGGTTYYEAGVEYTLITMA